MYASRIRVSVGFLAQRWELRRSALGGASSGELRVTTDIWRINATLGPATVMRVMER